VTGWQPRGITAGEPWTCLLGLTDPDSGKPRPVYRGFAELGVPLPFGGWRRLVRLDDTGTTGTGKAHPAGVPASQVVLELPGDVTAALPERDDAVLEVWIQPAADAEPYWLLQAPFPIRPKVAELP
jgi:hypothetical protein